MLTALAISGATITAWGWVVFNLRKAPEAFEDESGFHHLKSRVPGSKVVRTEAKPGHLSALSAHARLN
jgi:hypothetical protein